MSGGDEASGGDEVAAPGEAATFLFLAALVSRAAAAGVSGWLLLLLDQLPLLLLCEYAAAAGCYCWLELAAVAGCCWLEQAAAAAGCCCQPELADAAGCCCWLELAADDCYTVILFFIQRQMFIAYSLRNFYEQFKHP